MPPEPVYAVSGFPRSGTSMMMRCLEAGGLVCVYDRSGDADRNRPGDDGYVPNPHGYYEGAPLGDPTAWEGWRGKAVKLVRDNLCFVPPGVRLAVVYMVRDPAEIARSYRKTLTGPHPDPVGFLDGYHEKASDDVERLEDAGHEVTPLFYADVVDDPLRRLGGLARRGWPIDAARAAAAVDPTLYRHRGAA